MYHKELIKLIKNIKNKNNRHKNIIEIMEKNNHWLNTLKSISIITLIITMEINYR